MRCIFILDEHYEVKTYWGWFRLDRGAYEDYLAGKLSLTFALIAETSQLQKKLGFNALRSLQSIYGEKPAV